MPELTLFDPSGFAQVDQFDALAAQEADVLIPDLEGLPATATLTESPEDRTGIENRRFSSSVIRLSWARSRSVSGKASIGTPPVWP